MSKYISLLMLFALLFFVGCGKLENPTSTNSLGVFKDSVRKTLVVLSTENILKTHLAKVMIGDEKNENENEERFELIVNQQSSIKVGDKVKVFINYYDDKGVTRKWLTVSDIIKKEEERLMF